MATAEIYKAAGSLRRNGSMWRSSGADVFSRSSRDEDDEEALKWAALEKLPTYNRLRKGLLMGSQGAASEVDVDNLGFQEKQSLMERLVKIAEEDNEKFLLRLRNRIERVGITIPEIEVRFEHLTIDAEAFIGSRACLHSIILCSIKSRRRKFTILHDVSGIIKPQRMTLLLGPPSSGKTTLLLALSGKLDPLLRVTYNGHGMDEFVPQRTAAYISQHDTHIGEMTARRLILILAILRHVSRALRREKAANIKPDPDLDVFMKAAATEGQKENVVTDYTLKILGLDICADTMFNNFSNCELSQATIHILNGTAVISLLQPAPETYNLFDDIILLSDGHIVYQGPREDVLEFFESTGFRCPERKGVADFLQEVTSKKDQQQYWARKEVPYRFVTVKEFAEAFQSFHTGRKVGDELASPYDKTKSHPAALTTKKYGVNKKELLDANMSREYLLMKRNSFVYVFKLTQLAIMAVITMTLFLRTEMHRNSVDDGNIYTGALFFTVVMIMFNGMAELAMAIAKLPVFYKQRDLLFYPAWAYALPTWILKIPITFIEVGVWVFMTYYVIGFDPNVERLFRQYLLLLLVNQMASGLFRLIASSGRNMIVSNTFGAFVLLMLLALGGVILSHDDVKKWWIWGYWCSPLMYAQNAIVVNEFLGHSWKKNVTGSTESLGVTVLNNRGFFTEAYWYWIGAGALFGFILLFNFGYTLCLNFLNPFDKPQAVIVEESDNAKTGGQIELSQRNSSIDQAASTERGEEIGRSISSTSSAVREEAVAGANHNKKKGMVLPFQPYSITFDDIRYSVDMPEEMKSQGVVEDKLELLKGVSGAFRPGVLTALMGVSGAGKTTLMDVLAGRKTGGYIEGNISISGYPKKQETFARISGYCEQNDIHSPHVTVYESLLYSAWLRLSSDVKSETRKMFIEEVMELVELTPLRDALVGLPGVNGLSTEQRKRLTIAVELVANPSIIFMDEPTSGLDARAAAIVMRTVRNTVTQEEQLCAPSINQLLLLKRGGQEIYVGPLGRYSCHLINYFEGIEGVSKIKDGYNPATWMLEATTAAQEATLGVDFTEIYKNSDLYRACLWKQRWSYWRNPPYTAVRFLFTTFIALLFGTMFWDLGTKRSTQQDLFNAMGSMYAAVLFLGIQNSQSVQPVVVVERTVFYRERAAGMYSPLSYAFAQALVEIPYIFSQAVVYGLIVYAMIGFEWTAAKFFWYLFFMFFTLMYFTFYGMMAVAATPNQNIASIVAAAFYGLWNLFSGFIVPRNRIPVWWRWYYWICPVSWTLYGLVTSQFGDITEELNTGVTVKDYLNDYFGFKHDFLGVVAAVVVGFVVLFLFIFAYAIKALNFQRR
ncbi:Pleiotropic drug resistance protein 1 [Vitis vinifera]|uniref:Pleiotropic drug resistance protein 1 n=1 Tax=Vitis vinifera TaxID=29760 RepID=A0A438CZU9_VITVI|nr:Pleiotropic drug resistance protein 1 [Vitis vinifera]